MNFYEFEGIKISGMAVAVPDNHHSIMEKAHFFAEGEVQRFCESTGIWSRYMSDGIGTTTADLCVVAANKLFEAFAIDRSTVDGLILVTQTPDYFIPPTSCVIQHRLGMDDCGLVYDSNIGCTAFPFGIQMACANIKAGCKKVLLLVGDANPDRGDETTKDGMLFGDAGTAMLLEATEEPVAPIRICIDTIGSGYKALITPYGMQRHNLYSLYRERGIDYALGYNNATIMEGSDVFTFSIKDAPKTTKAFYAHFGCSADDYDMISIHQANKMIVDNVAKRIKAPKEKVHYSLDRFGNTRGASTAVNICDYAAQNNLYSGKQKILNLAFGVGLNVTLAEIELNMSRVLPLIKTTEAFDDGITNYTYF